MRYVEEVTLVQVVFFIVIYELANILLCAFYLDKSCEKAIFLMRLFGSVVLTKHFFF